MTGCKGYGLRGSDARTEIERTKEADTPGEIPGRSGLQADRQTETSLSIMRGAWLRSKETEEIIMTLSMKEKKILYAYGCPSHHNTVTRLKWLNRRIPLLINRHNKHFSSDINKRLRSFKNLGVLLYKLPRA